MNDLGLSSFPATSVRLRCGESFHTVAWAAGDVMVPDHEDPEGERALAALGGPPAICLDVLGAWERHSHDPRLLTVAPRGPGDLVQGPSDRAGGAPGRSRAAQGGGGAAYANLTLARSLRRPGGAPMLRAGRARALGPGVSAFALTGPRPMGARALGQAGGDGAGGDGADADLALLAGLGQDMVRRLVATVTAGLLAHDNPRAGGPAGTGARTPPGGAGPYQAVLTASLFGRATNALAHWLGVPAADITVEVSPPGQAPSVELFGQDEVRLWLPLEWVSEVWGRSLTEVAGRFVLSVHQAGDGAMMLETVGADLGRTLPVTVRIG